MRGGTDTWHLDTISCFFNELDSQMFVSNGNAGPTCLPDSSTEKSELLSPPVVLPASASITLAFDALSFDEAGRCLPALFFNVDAKDVGITTDGGSTYTTLNACFPITDGTGALMHHEFDISAFAGQTIQVIFVYDTFDNEVKHTFAVDNVTIIVAQANSDTDPAGDDCDCAPTDPSAFAIPLEINNLTILSNQETLEWDSDAANSGTGMRYDLMRGSLDELPVGSGVSEICVDPDSIDTTADDTTVPSSGTGSYYFVRGSNVCGPGSYGTTSFAVKRLSAACP